MVRLAGPLPQRCPRPRPCWKTLPLADVPGIAPSAFFSVPQAQDPHPAPYRRHQYAAGGASAADRAAGLLVIAWAMRRANGMPGKALMFDDSIEHEAWNGSDQPRIILIFDIWNPHLTPAERTWSADCWSATRPITAE